MKSSFSFTVFYFFLFRSIARCWCIDQIMCCVWFILRAVFSVLLFLRNNYIKLHVNIDLKMVACKFCWKNTVFYTDTVEKEVLVENSPAPPQPVSLSVVVEPLEGLPASSHTSVSKMRVRVCWCCTQEVLCPGLASPFSFLITVVSHSIPPFPTYVIEPG